MSDSKLADVGTPLTPDEMEQLISYVRWVPCPMCADVVGDFASSQFCIVCIKDRRVTNITANKLIDIVPLYKSAVTKLNDRTATEKDQNDG